MAESFDEQAVAIVGMAGRFPGARDLSAFWQNLCGGVESIVALDDARLEALGVAEGLRRDPRYVKASAALEGFELFDAPFFGFSPREAELMDPQHRVFLELCWHALERAGHTPELFKGSIGVFAGASTNTYLLYNLAPNAARLGPLDHVQVDVANGGDFLCTRVAYKLGLRGPAYTVLSACSTSLVAVHLAAQSLLNDECDLALAGGVSVHVQHPQGYLYAPDGILSPDGHCRPFDARAGGTVFGSGAGVVVLRRLADALRDGDHVHAVLKGSAVNNDGAAKVGYTAPGVEGQAAVVREALDVAGVEPASVGYIEAHGTGTRLGDPIEVRALTKAFGKRPAGAPRVALGSLKGNVGHLANAAGVASLIKAALAVEEGRIPPSLHFERPNPDVEFDASPFAVQTALGDWPLRQGGPRRAGVSSFGVGGTNAHVVLEEAPRRAPSGPSRPTLLLPLSAKTPAALRAAQRELAHHLAAHPGESLADVAFTLQVGRQPMSYRRVVVCEGREQAIGALRAAGPEGAGEPDAGPAALHDRPVAFLFSGQGSQYVDMARGLYQSEPGFRDELDACVDRLRPHLGLDLRTLLYPAAPGLADEAAQRLAQTAVAQPALFAIEYALARLWMRWGVKPRALLGHSVGEFVAATLAGVFALDDALSLVAERGRLMQALPAGAMLSVGLGEAEVSAELGESLSLAAVNAPDACVVAGPFAAIEALEQKLKGRGVNVQRLHTSHAFHSAMMSPIVGAFAERVRRVKRNAPTLPIVSDSTGNWLEASQATDPDYWAAHLRQPVRFSAALATLASAPHTALLEVGPGRVLASIARRQPNSAGRIVVASTRHAREPGDDQRTLLGALGQLWQAGVAVDWRAFAAGEVRRRRPLPGYPFERQRYWVDAPRAATPSSPVEAPSAEVAPGGERPLEKRPDVADWLYAPSWRGSPAPASRPAPPAEGRAWLLFDEGTGLGGELAARLSEDGYETIRVFRGGAFGPREGGYELDPARRDDYGALFGALGARGTRLAGIVHLWGVTPGPAAPERVLEAGFFELAHLARGLAGRGEAEPVDCWVVASGACKVEGGDAISPDRAMALGACRVLPQELPQAVASCRLIDVASGVDARSLAARVHAELRAAAPEAVVALRGRRRWVQTFEPLRLGAEGSPTSALRRGGAYLVIEGLEGVGLAFARALAGSYKARLALIEAEGLPPPERWGAEVAARGPDDPLGRKLRAAQELEAAGAEVLVLGADLTDAASMRDAVGRALERFGRLDGALHAASGMRGAAFQPLHEATPDACAPLFGASVRALSALEAALPREGLDFCLLVSSLAAVLGGPGQGPHAAAGQFSDAFAERASEAGGYPWINVAWDAWRLDGHDAAELGPLLSLLAIAPDEGVEVARRVIARGEGGSVVVSTADLGARRRRAAVAPAGGRPAAATAREVHARPELATPYVAPRDDAERAIASTWGRALGVGPVGIDDNFFELGGNSLIAVQMLAGLGKELGAEVPVASLYQRPTVRALAELLGRGGDGAARERAEKLARRKEELGRRNEWLRRRRG
jgi:acyl transferase domain-containing protein/acyl carrier protein